MLLVCEGPGAMQHSLATQAHKCPSGFRRDVSSEVKTPVDWMPMPFTFEPGESQPLLHDRSAISQEML